MRIPNLEDSVDGFKIVIQRVCKWEHAVEEELHGFDDFMTLFLSALKRFNCIFEQVVNLVFMDWKSIRL